MKCQIEGCELESNGIVAPTENGGMQFCESHHQDFVERGAVDILHELLKTESMSDLRKRLSAKQRSA